MIKCEVCGHLNNSSRVKCEKCGSDLSKSRNREEDDDLFILLNL